MPAPTPTQPQAAATTAPAGNAPGPAQAAAPADTRASAPGGILPGSLDEKARRLAEFFNGEVVDLDGPLEETGEQNTAA
jgi:DNA polymerase-3 subunit gamma/tau